MEKLKNFFKSLIIRLVICENLVLASMLTQSLGTVSYLFLCAIPVVLFWRIGILKLCWKIIKGFFSIFAGGGSSSSSVDDGEPEQIITAYEKSGWVYIDTNKGEKRQSFPIYSYDNGKLLGYTSSTFTIRKGSFDYTYDVKGKEVSSRRSRF